MDIFEQKRRIITTAIVAVVLTGISIAVVVSTPLINQIHTQAADTASLVADAKAESVRAVFDQHQDLARQTASRSELARVMVEYNRGNLALADLRTFSRPRLDDAAKNIDNLAAIVRFDASGAEVVRVGPLDDQLPADLPMPSGLDIQSYPVGVNNEARPLLHVIAAIREDEQIVGYDLLLFELSPLIPIFRVDADSSLCLLDVERTRRLIWTEGSHQFQLTTPNGCLAEQEGIDYKPDLDFFRASLPDGTRVLAFIRLVEGYGWEIHMNVRTSSVFGKVIEDIVISVVLILMLSALAGTMVWRSLMPVVHALVNQASQIARSTDELRLAQQVFNHTHEAIVICDTGLQVIRANPAFNEITGATPKTLRNTNLLAFMDSDRCKEIDREEIHRHLVAENAWQGEVWLTGPDNDPFPNLLTVSPVRNARGQIQQLILTFSDITARVQAEKQMFRLAHFDKLTGLPNRTALETHLEQAIEQARRQHHHFALMFLDLDKFKPVNDTMGHQAGDELLRNVARRLKHSIRANDVVGRRGGDEFVIITGPLTNDADAQPIARKMIQVLNEPFHIQGRTVQIGASVGIALYPDNGQTAEQLLATADKAMYSVKTSGRNNLAFA
ncbi:sensor domain-containing diguanylate cyclase [Marinobacter sp. bablab_jr008]|jgi:diguanylate cyclase (GGDEF)-like protein/PAS domain S-box-containing protein|uniref:sensor domain-containing diguanylate cyclase n=1 Tax=Marinobacter sp. bablab_jr008 TaxID=2755064 RepID=UPI0018F2711F|nr:sensor domain-containing diguanylate cyclase [Marinobacter sp. bablab_jr008]MEC9040753.1 sensor domain-containing diguanylate cyclase [Pseudomonadota bacterium]MEC9387773.1 sensor domain-containing diguanylate cyclase [Pseudomonadota bacterium]MED5466733.1 sensor domain-containing diguanylate cyclase [Pseudomonadota bacterium]